MLDLQEIQIIAQLVDNMEVLTNKIEDAYKENNGEKFNKSKREILSVQRKISEMIK